MRLKLPQEETEDFHICCKNVLTPVIRGRSLSKEKKEMFSSPIDQDGRMLLLEQASSLVMKHILRRGSLAVTALMAWKAAKCGQRSYQTAEPGRTQRQQRQKFETSLLKAAAIISQWGRGANVTQSREPQVPPHVCQEPYGHSFIGAPPQPVLQHAHRSSAFKLWVARIFLTGCVRNHRAGFSWRFNVSASVWWGLVNRDVTEK